MPVWKEPLRFDWDTGNRDKNWIKHGVRREECEEAFFDPDKRHHYPLDAARAEERHLLTGQTRSGRVLFIVFTIRKDKIRIISARDLNRREKHFYE